MNDHTPWQGKISFPDNATIEAYRQELDSLRYQSRRPLTVEEEAEKWFSDPTSDARLIPEKYRGTKAHQKATIGNPEYQPLPKCDFDHRALIEDLQSRLLDAKKTQQSDVEYQKVLINEMSSLRSRLDLSEKAALKHASLYESLHRMESDLGKVERAIGSIKFKEIVEGKQ